MCLLAILMFLEKFLFRYFADLLIVFFFMILSCMSYFYTLGINPLLVTSFANIFSWSISCFFILFTVFFAVQKLLSFIKSHLSIFISITLGQERNLKKILLHLYQRTCMFLDFPGVLVIKKLPANAGDAGDVDLTPEWGRPLG